MLLRAASTCLLGDAQGVTVLRAIQKGNQPALIASLAVDTRDLYAEAAVGVRLRSSRSLVGIAQL